MVKLRSKLWRLRKHDEVPVLTEQFFLTLRSIYSELRPEKPTAGQLPHVERIDTLLEGGDCWAGAYEIEQQMVFLYEQPTLKVELARRLVEAQGVLKPVLLAEYLTAAKAAESDDAQRALLARLVNDLQWLYTIRESKQRYARQTLRGTSVIGILALLLFGFTLFFHTGLLGRTIGEVALAGAAALWGASFSMSIGQRKRASDISFNVLKVSRTPAFLASRAGIGLAAGIVLYFMFTAGVLQGAPFPKPQAAMEADQAELVCARVKTGALEFVGDADQDAAKQALGGTLTDFSRYLQQIPNFVDSPIDEWTAGQIVLDLRAFLSEENTEERLRDELEGIVRRAQSRGLKDLALLVIWAFLAGFSEKLVPSILRRTENSATAEPEDSAPTPKDATPIVVGAPPADELPNPPEEEDSTS